MRGPLWAFIADVTTTVLTREKEKLMQAIEGKTKIIIDAGDGTVLIRSKDDITAGDGAKHDVIEGKAASSTTTTCNIFQLLNNKRVPTHFVERLDAVTFRARNVEMIPLELVARRIATGSFLDRNDGIADGTVFAELVFEVFEILVVEGKPSFQGSIRDTFLPLKQVNDLGENFIEGHRRPSARLGFRYFVSLP